MILNNQKMIQESNCAVIRIVKLPIVRSAWSILSDLYTDTKSSHPNLKVMCDALENRAVILRTMALNAVSPVMMKLEPQISIANVIACKSLNWLESAFPLLQAPTEEVVAIAMEKLQEAQEVVSVTATSTVGYIQHTVEQAMDKVVHMDYYSGPVIERVVTVAEGGLEQALSFSEALVDRMLPPAEEENEEEPNSVQGFESTTVRTYPVRLLSVSTKLCVRTCKAIEKLSSSPTLAQRFHPHLLNLICIPPLYLQYQAMTVILFISQMYTLSCPSPPEHIRADTNLSTVAQVSPSHKDLLQVQWQESPTWRLKPNKAMDCECTNCKELHLTLNLSD